MATGTIQATAQQAEKVATVDIDKHITVAKTLITQGDWVNLWHMAIPYLINFLIVIAIFIIGKKLSRIISHMMGRAITRTSKDEMLGSFVSSISYFALLLIVIIAALSKLGLNTSSLVALIGAAGLAIGLSLQNSLSNFAAGVMILIFKPFKKDQWVEVGSVAGTVTQMGILMLELRTGDNRTILIPNSKVFNSDITNYNLNPTRRIDLVLDIAYSASITQAKKIVEQILSEDSRILKDPAPQIVVGNLGASSVQIYARPWVNTSDYWPTRFDLLEKIKLTFDEAGIEIPFNQMDIHIRNSNPIYTQDIQKAK